MFLTPKQAGGDYAAGCHGVPHGKGLRAMSREWNAALYDQHHRFVADLARDMVAELAPQKGERVLDLGCGSGRMTEWLLEAGAQVLGIDPDPKMVEAARARCPSAEIQRLDARDLGDIRVDSVISNATLHWIPEAEKVVSELARVLNASRARPAYTGRVVAEFGGHGNIATLREAVAQALSRRGKSVDWSKRWYFPRLGEYTSLLERHGFEVSEARWWARPTKLEDGAAGLRNWVQMFLSELVAEHASDDFYAEVDDFCRPTLWHSDHWQLDYVRLRVHARLSD